MIKLKLRGKHCPVNFTGRTRIEAKRVIGGLLEYELNPDMLTDLFDEQCERNTELTRQNRDYETRLSAYRKPAEDIRVQGGKGYGE